MKTVIFAFSIDGEMKCIEMQIIEMNGKVLLKMMGIPYQEEPIFISYK